MTSVVESKVCVVVEVAPVRKFVLVFDAIKLPPDQEKVMSVTTLKFGGGPPIVMACDESTFTVVGLEAFGA